MTFFDLIFIFRLIPIFLIIYYILPCSCRAWLLLVASIGFYYINEPVYIAVISGATLINYILAKLLLKKKSNLILAVGVVANVSCLAFFKGASTFGLNIIIPLGISYYIFKMISYLADLYNGKIQSVEFKTMATYFFMFPQITAGPIARMDYVTGNQFWVKSDKTKKEKFFEILLKIEEGLKLFAIGLFMKVMIADHLSVLWNDIKTIGYESISTPLAWLGAYSYSFELYFDFWGYSLMAAGIGIMLGFPFISNFNQPYFSKSISEFYRNWHSTLGAWFRDYVYFPLGGNRKGKLRTVFNIFVVWAFTGIWHGLTFNFWIWAGILFVIIVLEKFLLGRFKKLFKVRGRFNVLVIIPITWVVFAIHSLKYLRIYLLRMFPVIDISVAVNKNDYLFMLEDYWLYLVLAVIFTIPALTGFYKKHKNNVFTILVIFAMFWISIFSLANSAGNPFMYLRF